MFYAYLLINIYLLLINCIIHEKIVLPKKPGEDRFLLSLYNIR